MITILTSVAWINLRGGGLKVRGGGPKVRGDPESSAYHCSLFYLLSQLLTLSNGVFQQEED